MMTGCRRNISVFPMEWKDKPLSQCSWTCILMQWKMQLYYLLNQRFISYVFYLVFYNDFNVNHKLILECYYFNGHVLHAN